MEWMGGVEASGYGVMSYSRRTSRKAHRVAIAVAMGSTPTDMQVDHTCFNRICVNPLHLRLVTPKQNMENKRGAYRNNSSGIRGVNLHKATGKYRARLRHHGEEIYLGLFPSAEEAGEAVKAKREELFTHSQN